MTSYINFFGAEYQSIETRYTQEAPGIINEVIKGTREAAEKWGREKLYTEGEISSRAFRLALYRTGVEGSV